MLEDYEVVWVCDKDSELHKVAKDRVLDWVRDLAATENQYNVDLYRNTKTFTNDLSIYDDEYYERITSEGTNGTKQAVVYVLYENEVVGLCRVVEMKVGTVNRRTISWWVYGVYIDKPHRGKGVAKALMNKVLKYAKEDGVETVQLDAFECNVAAVKLYKSLGFKTNLVNMAIVV